MKPLVFLDVDGVINVTNHHLRYVRKNELLTNVVEGFQIAVLPEMPEKLRQLTEDAEVVWLTTWRCRANKIGQWLGLPELECIDDGSGDRYTNWKWPTAKARAAEALEAGRKVMWIEDFYESKDYFRATEAGVLCWDTTPRDHLPIEEIDMILEWCQTNS